MAFNVYLENLKYTNMTQIAKYEFTDLIALIGGYLSLFLGISILTIVETLEVVLKILFKTFKLEPFFFNQI